MKIYRNRLILNQRGGSIDISNTTDQEKIKLSHRSGSNINITNVVSSELATNNKQINVLNDMFESVSNDRTIFTGKNLNLRTGENTTHLKGFTTQDEISKFTEWKESYRPVAETNSLFKINRGGESFPNGLETPLDGQRSKNPVIENQKIYVVENEFSGYSGTPLRTSFLDEVTLYSRVPQKGPQESAKEKKITESDVEQGAGNVGSKAPGVLKYGPSLNASTEQGTWSPNVDAQNIGDDILNIQNVLTPIEQQMGNGGDEIYFTKRDKFEQIGAEFNDYPSVRIDEEGRSQPFEMVVSKTGVFKNHDSIPHVEIIDNSSNFPCGNDNKIIGNGYTRTVGSGGISLKTTGIFEVGTTIFNLGSTAINLNASHGISIASESGIELQSLKTITLRTNRQVYVESALGVKNNAIIGGGMYVEGELYCQHLTAPLEVHQTENTTVMGKFAADRPRTLVIGECHVGNKWYPVYALPTDNLILNYPHSHHHNGPAMRLTKANKDVRDFASLEGINVHNNIAQSLPQNHEHKYPMEVDFSI